MGEVSIEVSAGSAASSLSECSALARDGVAPLGETSMSIIDEVAEFDFDEPETPEHIVYAERRSRRSDGPREVRAATLTKLVAHLTHPKAVDPEYLTAFLLTYRSFTTPSQLLRLLRARFAVPLPQNVSEDELRLFHRFIVVPIRLRVINVTKHWLKKHAYDFDTDPSLRDAALRFVDDVGATHPSYQPQVDALREMLISSRAHARWRGASAAAIAMAAGISSAPQEEPSASTATASAAQAVAAHTAAVEAAKAAGLPVPASPPELPIEIPTCGADGEPSGLLRMSAAEVAAQLTLMASRLFKAAAPKEFLKKQYAPNVSAISAHFNAVAKWVAWEVTYESTAKERGRIVVRFIEIAIECYRLQAFSVTQSIMSAFSTSALHRLEHTWREARALGGKRLFARWADVQSALSFEDNHKAPMELLMSAEPPCVPFVGMFLTKLNQIEEGNPAYYTPPAATPPAAGATVDAPAPSRLVNFSKRHKIAQVIAKIQTYQTGEYPIRDQPAAKSYLQRRFGAWEAALLDASLRGNSGWNARTACGKMLDDAMWKLSLVLEPRQDPAAPPSSPRRGSVMPGAETSRPPAANSSPRFSRRGSMPG